MKLAAAVLALMLGGVSIPAFAPTHPVEKPATLLLGFSDGTCSGTAVGPHLVLTAEHCVVEGPLVKINGEPAKAIGAPVLDGQDHALVTVDVTFKRYATLGGPLYQGQALHFWGNPAGLRDIFRRCYVSGQDGEWWVSDCTVDRGDSGSGIFDARGYVVGVVSSFMGDGVSSFMGAKQLKFSRAQLASVGL